MKQIFVAIALYLAATLSAAASTVTFDDLAFGGVAAPLIRLGGTAEEFEIGASSGLFADGAGVLSTNFDSDAMIVDFAGPQKSVTFTGGLTGEVFDWLSGMITLSAGGIVCPTSSQVARQKAFRSAQGHRSAVYLLKLTVSMLRRPVWHSFR